MATEDDYTEGFSPIPAGSEPPEGLLELAQQEEAAGTAGEGLPSPAPPVVGRTWALDPDRGRLLPEGGQPLPVRGEAAQRQAIEKCLRTERGAAAIHSDQYGYEGASRAVEGQAFDAEAYGEVETRLTDALVGSIPWVLSVEDFDAVDLDPLDEFADVSFQVIPEGEDLDPIDVNSYPLPIPSV